MVRLGAIKFALTVVIGAFAVAAVYISLTIVERQKALHEVSRYNIVWAASQALPELQRFERRVAEHMLGLDGADQDEVLLRYDILYNRLDILRSGDFVPFLAAEPHQGEVIEAFAAALADIEPLVGAIDRAGAGEKVLARVAPLDGQLARFAAAANQFSGEQVAEDQAYLLKLHLTFSLLAGGLVMCGVAFIGLLFFQNRAVNQAHAELSVMTSELRVAKDAAEAASEAKSRFLATMSHELRTPLNAVIGFSEIMRQETFGPIGQPKYRQYLDDIHGSGRHMLDLVTDILTVAKMDAGQMELTFTSVCPHTLADRAVRMVRGAETGKDRDIAIEPGGDWPTLRADESAVRQMLLNLLSNAVKFSAGDTPIRLRGGRNHEGGFVFTVSDRGVGMTAAEAELAPQPFFQADSRLSRKYAGTGLGLSIVKRLIEQHGGRLLIESQPGVGSDISLVFPKERVETKPLAEVA